MKKSSSRYKKFHSKFRKCSRMSYESYLKILQKIKLHKLFSPWDTLKTIRRGSPPAQIELLVLDCLRYLGRGWAFDDLEEATGTSAETHQKFLHLFLVWGSSCFFNETVIAYNGNKIYVSNVDYNLAGFPGCVGSGDATHVGLPKCYYKLAQYHNLPKLNMPS